MTQLAVGTCLNPDLAQSLAITLTLAQECLELLEPARDHYDFYEGDHVGVSENDGRHRFCASTTGTKDDNPSEPAEIYQREEFPDVHRQSVRFEFRDTHVMKIKYSVGCCVQTGRRP